MLADPLDTPTQPTARCVMVKRRQCDARDPEANRGGGVLIAVEVRLDNSPSFIKAVM